MHPRHLLAVPILLGTVALTPLAAGLAQEPAFGAPSASVTDATGESAPRASECVVTGHLRRSNEDPIVWRRELTVQPVNGAAGVPLEPGQTWVIPDGRQPFVVLDSASPLSGGESSVSIAGQVVSTTSEPNGPAHRYLADLPLSQLGPVTRIHGLTVSSGPCQLQITIAVERPVWSTLVGVAGLILTGLSGAALVLVARLRRGSWRRRFLLAAPFGLLLGVGQAVVLLETGLVGPFATPPVWLVLLGLALAALLPFTRWPRPGSEAPQQLEEQQPEEQQPEQSPQLGRPGRSRALAAVVNAAVAVMVGSGLVLGAMLGDPRPAVAGPGQVITPGQGELIFANTIAEGLRGDYSHIDDDAYAEFRYLQDNGDLIASSELSELVVGVPPDQEGYRGWFVGSALLTHDEGVVSLFGTFQRTTVSLPWLLTELEWSTSRRLSPPALEGEWLAPEPGLADLLVDPEEVPERYAAWLDRSAAAREVVVDDLLGTSADSGMLATLGSPEQTMDRRSIHTSSDQTIEWEEARAGLVPLADGTVRVLFDVSVRHVIYNRRDHSHEPCDELYLWYEDEPDQHHRSLVMDLTITVYARIPITTAEPEPGFDPEAEPAPESENDPAPAGAADLPREPFDRSKVLIDDSNWYYENQDGVPC